MLIKKVLKSCECPYKFGNVDYMTYFCVLNYLIKTFCKMSQKKDRSGKQQAFKSKEKQKAAQKAIPRTHLVPVPEWQSNENLDFNGQLLDVAQQQFVIMNEAMQRLGQVFHAVISGNIKSGKVKINYVWNNGEPASKEEAEAYQKQLADLKASQQQFIDQTQQLQNAAKTGLVGPDGEPVGTTQNLDTETQQDEETEETSDEQPNESAEA